jgi:putative transposase
MQIGNRFRCYPTPEQAQTLLRWIGCQRHIYNAKVREDRYFRAFARKSLQHTGQYAPIDQQYAHFKTELTPWLFDVPSVVLRNGAVLWKQAYSRYFTKLAGRPVVHKKHGKQSVWLTSELFEFAPKIDQSTGEVTGHQLHVGTKKLPLGILAFKAHKAYQVPASIHISVHAGRWHLSFNYDDGLPEPKEQDTIAWLRQFDEAELLKITIGLDRGVALPVAAGDYQRFEFSAIQKKRLRGQARQKKRWQRRLARRKEGSSGWKKAKARIARHQRYGNDVRHDLAHKTSCAIASDARYKLIVFEDLQVQNMTKRAKPKQDEHGCWLSDGASAKSALNQAILASTWGKTQVFTQYKVRRRGKLVIATPPYQSSQECAACGHIHPENRISQSVFLCQRCGHREHADHNAAQVIALRGVRQLLAGKCAEKVPKRCRITRSQVGAEGSEPVVPTAPSTPGKIRVSRPSGNTTAHGSLIQETLATTPSGD